MIKYSKAQDSKGKKANYPRKIIIKTAENKNTIDKKIFVWYNVLSEYFLFLKIKKSYKDW